MTVIYYYSILVLLMLRASSIFNKDLCPNVNKIKTEGVFIKIN
jgi:hypothetical protein